MDIFTNAKSKLEKMELSDEVKSSLNTIFDNLKTESKSINDELIGARDSVKDDNKALKTKLSSISTELKLESDFKVEDLVSRLSNKDDLEIDEIRFRTL